MKKVHTVGVGSNNKNDAYEVIFHCIQQGQSQKIRINYEGSFIGNENRTHSKRLQKTILLNYFVIIKICQIKIVKKKVKAFIK